MITTMTINANRSMTIGGTAEVDSTLRVTFPDSTFQGVTATGGAYSVTSTANMPGGTVTVVSTDALGNVSAPATTDLFPDYDGPTVTITGAPARLLDETPFTITVTFSEAVTGFTQPDIAVTGANITAFAGASPTYTAEITPVVATPITISISERAAEDAFANPSAASGVISITNAALTAIEEMIVTMAETRTRSTMSAQPKISRFLLGGRPRPLGNRGRH